MHNNRPLTHLGDISVEDFLKNYWQKKPLFIKNALPNIPKIPADELAGYALEEEVESRILIETPKTNKPLASEWKLMHGPMTEDTFTQLPQSHWTLLVQAVDQLNADIHGLLDRFRFLPNWRLDDIMVSYATDQGNVGPHFDYYDVFLLQASGERLWQLGQKCSSQSELRRDTDCKVLGEFESSSEHLAQCGDLLYIPPQLAHWGIAQGECITYSVGFRAPSHSDILLDLAQELASSQNEDQRYCDPDLAARTNPGLIDSSDLNRVKALIQGLLNDPVALEQWFGRFMTQEKRETLCFETEASHIENGLRLAPHVRAAYIQGSENNKSSLFLNGEHYLTSQAFAEAVCSYEMTNRQEHPQEQALIDQLLDSGELLLLGTATN